MFDEGSVLPEIVAVLVVSAVGLILILALYGWA
jgi:hypothetical protein